MSKAKSTWDTCCHLKPSDWYVSHGYCTCTLHKMAPSVCRSNLNKITCCSIKALNHFLCKSTLHLHNDLTGSLSLWSTNTHASLTHSYLHSNNRPTHSCEPGLDLTIQQSDRYQAYMAYVQSKKEKKERKKKCCNDFFFLNDQKKRGDKKSICVRTRPLEDEKH